MDKEKEIQELERVICPCGCNFSYKSCSECECYRETFEEEEDFCDLDCVVEARNIYNAGYRNAKTMLDDLTDKIMTAPILDEPQRQFLKGVVMGMRMKYEVEGDK